MALRSCVVEPISFRSRCEKQGLYRKRAGLGAVPSACRGEEVTRMPYSVTVGTTGIQGEYKCLPRNGTCFSVDGSKGSLGAACSADTCRFLFLHEPSTYELTSNVLGLCSPPPCRTWVDDVGV